MLGRAGNFPSPLVLDANDPVVNSATGGTGVKLAAGTGAFVSGAVTIATGLALVTGFSLTPTKTATGPATGATEITNWSATITTGAVALQGYSLWTITASVSGTMGFSWVAVGT